MTSEELLKLTANIAILYTGVTLLAFIVLYGFFFDWRSTGPGRSVMYFVGSLELLIVLAAFLQWQPIVLQEETKQLLRVEVYITIATAATRMLVVLIGRWRVTGRVEIDVPLRDRDRSKP